MQRFSEKCRRGLRNFFLFLGVSAISLVFQACYGMPLDDWDEDEGRRTEGESLDACEDD